MYIASPIDKGKTRWKDDPEFPSRGNRQASRRYDGWFLFSSYKLWGLTSHVPSPKTGTTWPCPTCMILFIVISSVLSCRTTVFLGLCLRRPHYSTHDRSPRPEHERNLLGHGCLFSSVFLEHTYEYKPFYLGNICQGYSSALMMSRRLLTVAEPRHIQNEHGMFYPN